MMLTLHLQHSPLSFVCFLKFPDSTYYFQIDYVSHVIVTWLREIECKVSDNKDCHLLVYASSVATMMTLAKGRKKCKNEAQHVDC